MGQCRTHPRCSSVKAYVFDKEVGTADSFVVRTIQNAEATFIARGGQSKYVRYWVGRPVQDAISHVAVMLAPIGSNSAGMVVLAKSAYSCEGQKNLTDRAALTGLFAPDLKLARDFTALPGLENVITDQHLRDRDRIGRTSAL